MFKMLKIVKKIWGSEDWIANNELYCGKILNLLKGYRCSIHYHLKKHETFYVLNGKILLELNGKNKIMKSGDIQEIKPNEKHRFTGLEDSKIIEFSTHHEDSDSYRDEDSGKVDINKLMRNLNC